MGRHFTLLLLSDYEADPNRITLTVHPNDYSAVAAMLREGVVFKGEPQTVDALEVSGVALLSSGRSSLTTLASQALNTEAGQSPCVHCSYSGERKYKMCDGCLALWLEANGYDMSGQKL